MRKHGCVLWGLALLLWGGAFAPSSADAAGYGRWDLPSNLAQYFGYGFGPGYHAPRIRVAPTPTGVGGGFGHSAVRTRPAWWGVSFPGAPWGVGSPPARADAATPWATAWPVAGPLGVSLAPAEAWPAGRVEPLPPPRAAPPQR
jgi:hypothetical protein